VKSTSTAKAFPPLGKGRAREGIIQHLNVFGDVTAPCRALAQKDKILARALDAVKRPTIRRRRGGFEGAFRIIVEQQVSEPSARAIWTRCKAGLRPVTPDGALKLGAGGLRAFGLSGPKAAYVLGLAEAVQTGAVAFAALPALDDAAAAQSLCAIKGIGPWTAAIYLLFCEGRVDIWPPGDIALLGAYAAARRGGPKPAMSALDARARKWAPYRGLAAHILWTYYAHIKGREPI
jgi:DNA-3-methyladenine glycosylase II